MRAYVLISGVIFAVIVIAHLARIAAESAALASDFHFILLTVLAAVLALWAGWLLWSARRRT
ncbi:MAG TPA: hypothetical protein VF167_07130 [Longimicrobiaceae bacterium]